MEIKLKGASLKVLNSIAQYWECSQAEALERSLATTYYFTQLHSQSNQIVSIDKAGNIREITFLE